MSGSRVRRAGSARRFARGVAIAARAKLNLGLAIGPLRDDGFHDLATIFQSVSLADTLIARPARRGFRLEVRHENAARRGAPPRRSARVPAGRSNLVLRAARLLAARHALPGGARFTLIKRIPAEAGLGGGSADGAATFSALSALYGIRLSKAERLALAAALGSDVPFAALGGTALGLGRGEKLTPLELARPFEAVLAVPAWRISTPEAFARLDRSRLALTRVRAHLRFARGFPGRFVNVVRAMRMGNTFEEVLGDRKSDFEHLRARLEAAGASAVRMTGSGSAVFAIPGSRSSANEVVRRFTGTEALYVVRSTRAAARPRPL